MIHNSSSGFSLIELLVVVSLIGILLVISLPAFSQSRKGSRDAKRKVDLEQIRSALEVYRTDCKTYPSRIDSGQALSGVEDSCKGNQYMAEVPADPIPSSYVYFYSRGGANSYTLCAYLETSSGDAGCAGDCGENVKCNYKVTNP